MRRREFLSVLGGAAATWPLVARAKQTPRRIGIFMGLPESDPEAQGYIAAFRDKAAGRVNCAAVFLGADGASTHRGSWGAR